MLNRYSVPKLGNDLWRHGFGPLFVRQIYCIVISQYVYYQGLKWNLLVQFSSFICLFHTRIFLCPAFSARIFFYLKNMGICMKTRAHHMYSQAKYLDLTDLPKHKGCVWKDLACMQFSQIDARR
jgi:hypothetical protein